MLCPQIFLVCVWHADKLQHYLDNVAKWPRSLTVHCMPMPSCLSAGDALRELDSLGCIRSDPFVLISGDVISNMDLKKAMAFHKTRREQDHNAILTVCLKPVRAPPLCALLSSLLPCCLPVILPY